MNCSFSRDNPPLIPTDIGFNHKGHGYKQNKAKLGLNKVRPWRWMPFFNPARKVCLNFIVIQLFNAFF